MERRKVAPDNNCLFTSMAYLCQGIENEIELSGAARKLRTVCAEAVLTDPDPDTRAVLLGHDSVQGYAEWIQDKTHWGGEPEVLMLAEHFGVEVVVVSCETLSLLRYSESAETVYLLYTGQHYDPLVGAGGPRKLPTAATASADEIASREGSAIQIARDQNAEAKRKASERRVQRIKCGGCGAIVDDSAAFQAHCGEVEHDDDFTYECETIEVVISADEVREATSVDPLMAAPHVLARRRAMRVTLLPWSGLGAADGHFGSPLCVQGHRTATLNSTAREHRPRTHLLATCWPVFPSRHCQRARST